MSVAQVVEACALHATFVKLGYLYRAKFCLNVALVNLKTLKQRVAIPQVLYLLNKKEMECNRLLTKINTKINNRVLIKLYKL
ncbi:hypothetical protein Spob032 [Spilosoma obliqua nucleopolyhedrosis virus]|uniref:Uncharacterized protein n=1 Tax=Spilarctia obliqua nucleopolyhedrovirus TaxID=1638618 RepID=A0A7G9U8A2_9ABAC|nr:hypothetical protein Spob032 [Spilosoma obliqua nucleopolyhedrosis virus]QNN89333.1 hypothetical protein [Spilarctia obliqua nucleopolyhedrovirus]